LREMLIDRVLTIADVMQCPSCGMRPVAMTPDPKRSDPIDEYKPDACACGRVVTPYALPIGRVVAIACGLTWT
jgi:hypothetical protein